jgi:hypothetical protein
MMQRSEVETGRLRDVARRHAFEPALGKKGFRGLYDGAAFIDFHAAS